MRKFQKSAFSLLILLPCMLAAQNDTKFTYKKRELVIPNFQEIRLPDSINPTLAHRLLPPISQSTAKLEIRQYNAGSPRVSVVVSFNFYEDSCIKTVYTCLLKPPVGYLREHPEYTKLADYYCKAIRTKVPDSTAYAILDTLQKYCVFSTGDQTRTIDLLRKKGIKVKDPCEGIVGCLAFPIFYEVKLYEKYSGFYRVNAAYTQYNPTITEFSTNPLLLSLFSM